MGLVKELSEINNTTDVSGNSNSHRVTTSASGLLPAELVVRSVGNNFTKCFLKKQCLSESLILQ
jgi:hypothetical protein